jgi:hypothetical protein
MPLGGAGDRSRVPPGHLAAARRPERALRPSSCG